LRSEIFRCIGEIEVKIQSYGHQHKKEAEQLVQLAETSSEEAASWRRALECESRARTELSADVVLRMSEVWSLVDEMRQHSREASEPHGKESHGSLSSQTLADLHAYVREQITQALEESCTITKAVGSSQCDALRGEFTGRISELQGKLQEIVGLIEGRNSSRGAPGQDFSESLRADMQKMLAQGLEREQRKRIEAVERLTRRLDSERRARESSAPATSTSRSSFRVPLHAQAPHAKPPSPQQHGERDLVGDLLRGGGDHVAVPAPRPPARKNPGTPPVPPPGPPTDVPTLPQPEPMGTKAFNTGQLLA